MRVIYKLRKLNILIIVFAVKDRYLKFKGQFTMRVKLNKLKFLTLINFNSGTIHIGVEAPKMAYANGRELQKLAYYNGRTINTMLVFCNSRPLTYSIFGASTYFC